MEWENIIMNQLEEALREQIDYCVKMEHFHSAVFCSTREKKIIVEKLLDKILENIPKESHLLLSRRDNTSVLFFSNSNVLRVFNLSDLKTNRGYKCNGCIIDKEMPQELKEVLVYAKIIPRTFTMNGEYDYETWDAVKERVEEVWWPDTIDELSC
jgi:hypothetical protein